MDRFTSQSGCCIPRRSFVLFVAATVTIFAAMPMPARAQSSGTPGEVRAQSARTSPDLHDRIEGLLIGSVIGDAAGGPTEFRVPDRGPWIDRQTPLDSAIISDLARRFTLSPYVLVDRAAPYGPWRDDAPAGTVTDDTRFKILFMRSLAASAPVTGQSTGPRSLPQDLTPEAFAREILRWHGDATGPFGDLPREWLDEFALAARWVLGERDPARATPPERQWGGIATMAGQMPFLPVAALRPGSPAAAYLTTWNVNFLDNGWGRDMTAALVAGLAHALEPGATWLSIEETMRRTDPYGFSRVPWVERRVDRWLDAARSIARRAGGRADILYDLLESELGAETWWEAHVPVVVAFAAAETAGYDPLATMQLILEFGHDTDSYLQVAGAIVGALHGTAVFPDEMKATVERRLDEDFGESIGEWAGRLCRCSTGGGD